MAKASLKEVFDIFLRHVTLKEKLQILFIAVVPILTYDGYLSYPGKKPDVMFLILFFVGVCLAVFIIYLFYRDAKRRMLLGQINKDQSAEEQ